MLSHHDGQYDPEHSSHSEADDAAFESEETIELESLRSCFDLNDASKTEMADTQGFDLDEDDEINTSYSFDDDNVFVYVGGLCHGDGSCGKAGGAEASHHAQETDLDIQPIVRCE